MLDYNILGEKANTTIVRNGEANYCIDLLSSTYNKDLKTTGEGIIINKYYIGRPDLVSLAMYGDDKYGDILCKVNGISNPFELNEGMVIYCPTTDYLSKLLKGQQNFASALVVKNAESQENINSNGTSSSSLNNLTGVSNGTLNSSNTISASTVETDKNNLQKLSSDRRTPGDQTVTDNNYIVDKSLGIVIY